LKSQKIMKKLIFVLVIIVMPFLISAQVSPVATEWTGKIEPHKEITGQGTRSVPPGTLLWEQAPVSCPTNALSSELTSSINSEAADDFIFTTATGPVTGVKWWWWYNAGYGTVISWNIRIYSEASCLPNSLITSWSIPIAQSNEEFICIPQGGSQIDSYWATLAPNFIPGTGVKYFISIQAVLIDGYTYWCKVDQINGCVGVSRYGSPDWTNFYNWDFAFELYGGNKTPISNWALILGVVLIGTFVFIRYRRMA
jgi:hypothetical protein